MREQNDTRWQRLRYKCVELPRVEELSKNFNFRFLAIRVEPTVKQQVLFKLRHKKPINFRLWSRFSCSDGWMSYPRYYKRPQETIPAPRKLLLSHRQKNMNSKSVRIPLFSNQRQIFEKMEEVSCNAGAQAMERSGIELSHFVDLENVSVSLQLEGDADFIWERRTLFSPIASKDLEIGGSAGNPLFWMSTKTRKTLLQQL